jgi:chloramphenicol-sensitive protein RarD
MQYGGIFVKQIKTGDNEYRAGLICVLMCQLMWGFLPIYWQALDPIESWKIILYRILTMFVYSYIAARIFYSREEIWNPVRDMKVRLRYYTAGLILTANWSIYIWAMNSGRVIQASIGYYIEPIVICAFGIIIFHEKLTKYNFVAMLLALLAIIVILVHYRQIPGVALGLTLTWATYSAIKKAAELPPLVALVHETMPFAIIALIVIICIETRGIGAISVHEPAKYAAMYLSGLVTLIPVALFGFAAKKVPLIVIGIVQYISPTISLLLGIFLFKEPTDPVQFIAFAIIWTGLAIFSYGEVRNFREK